MPSVSESTADAKSQSAPTRPFAPTWRSSAIILAIVTAAFALPLYHLVRLGLARDLYSHVMLIPFVSGYLVWLDRQKLALASRFEWTVAWPFAVGALLLAGYEAVAGTSGAPTDSLVVPIAAYAVAVAGVCGLCLGKSGLRTLAFPLGFLVFMIPLPTWMATGSETFLQYGSANVASAMFNLAGTPVYHEDLLFHLPRIVLEVAPECSGIHSTLALLMTAVLASRFFLRRWSTRSVLIAFVVPLALLRNGFRIFTIGELCVHIGPQMIDSPIHHKGGPIFFLLSLIPFVLLLRFLMRWETKKTASPKAA